MSRCANWFECRISYEKILENGMQKKVVEPYLVDSLSFTEAEARITEEVRPFISGEFTVTDIKRARLSELFFNENGDRFYKIKVYFITLDEKSGAEKKTAAQMLAQACTLKEAIAVLEEGMKGTMADYSIGGVNETQIMDVFPFNAEVGKRADDLSKMEIEKAIVNDEKSIEDRMQEAKGIITRDPKTGDADLITRTQSFIRQKAGYDNNRYKEAAIEMALLQRSPAAQVWFMGCGQLLIEELEV